MKKCIAFLLLLSLLMMALPFGVLATETADTEQSVTRTANQCGENLTWSYADGVLTISGSGDMDDYEEGTAPWQEYKDSMTKVVLSGNVTSVGAHAFTDYDGLTAVEFGNSLVSIGYRAFKSCDNIFRIVLPETFRKFDEECFMGCQRLAEIWCRGGMPSFKASCIWDVSATIFYPPAKAWPPEYVIPLGDAFQWKIQFQTMDVPEEYLTTSAEVPVTEPVQTEAAATEPVVTEPAATEPPVTVPETTVPETQPETVATEPAVTETIPETEETKPAWMEEMEELEKNQQVSEEETGKKPAIGLGMIVGLCILIIILLLVLIGALVFRRRDY